MLLLSQVIIAIGSCTGFVGAGYIGGQWFGMAKFSFMFGLVQVVAALTSAFSVHSAGFGVVCLGLAVAFVVYYFSFQTGYSIVNPNVQKDIGFSLSQVATVAAIYTRVFALSEFLSGALLDRLGAGKIIPISIALVTIGVFVFANAENYGTLLLSQLIIAVGACSEFVGAGYVGGQRFGMAKFSFMFGLVHFAASFFSAFNQNLLSFALTKVPWRDLFNVIGFFGIILFVLGAIFIRNPPIARSAEGITAFFAAVAKGIVEVAKIPHVWVASAFGALCFGVMLGLGVVWAPKLLAARGFDAASANWSASLLWLGLAAGCFVPQVV